MGLTQSVYLLNQITGFLSSDYGMAYCLLSNLGPIWIKVNKRIFSFLL